MENFFCVLYNFSGEWWKADTEAVINQAMQTGLPPNISDSHTINGHVGPATGCTSQGICSYSHVNLPSSIKKSGDLTIVP